MKIHTANVRRYGDSWRVVLEETGTVLVTVPDVDVGTRIAGLVNAEIASVVHREAQELAAAMVAERATALRMAERSNK